MTVRHRPALFVVIIIVAAYSWWASGLPGFSWWAAAAVALPGAAVVVAVARADSRRADVATRLGRTGAVAWTSVIGGLIVWELIQYLSSPRSAHPTVSAFADQLLEPRVVRTLAFAAWLAWGWFLAR